MIPVLIIQTHFWADSGIFKLSESTALNMMSRRVLISTHPYTALSTGS